MPPFVSSQIELLCVSGFGDKPVHRNQAVGCAINPKEVETMKLSVKTKQEISPELYVSRGTSRENRTQAPFR